MLHWSTKYCQEDAEIADFRNLILPTDRNWPWGENRVTPTSVNLDLAKKIIKPWYTAWWIFPSHTLVQLLYNSYLQDLIWVKWSHQFTSLRSGRDYKEQWSHYSGCLVPSMFITGSEYNVSGPVIIMTSARGTHVWMWIHARAVTVTEEYWYHLRP